jgi:hypothetical protein
MVTCIWGLELQFLKPWELNHKGVTCHGENILNVKGGAMWPPRELSAEVQEELSTIVRVESIPKLCILLFVCQAVHMDEGVAEVQKLPVIL